MGERFVVGNWKLHKTCHEAQELVAALVAHPATSNPRVRCVVAPPSTALFAAHELVRDHPLKLCAQHIHAADEGAFTGEVSAPLVREAGARFVLVGHSERRSLFHESDEHTRLQVQAALRANLVPIVCVGETDQERQQKRTDAVVQRQLRAACPQWAGQPRTDGLPSLLVAYEPIWAIGTGRAAVPHEAQSVHGLIRQTLRDLMGAAGEGVPLLYGGSVTAAHAHAFVAQADIDGVLVGGASLRADSFLAIIEAVAQA